MNNHAPVRLVDPNTPHKILLHVEVDAVNFTPAVGTVALFRDLHWAVRHNDRYRGYLNAERLQCRGKEWFIPNPVGIVGKAAVEHLRKWWVKKQKVFDAARAREDGIEAAVGDRVLARWCHDECMGGSVGGEDYETLKQLGHGEEKADGWNL